MLIFLHCVDQCLQSISFDLITGVENKADYNRSLQKVVWYNIKVNNVAVQYHRESIKEITPEQLKKTFRTNIFSYFYMVQAVMKYIGKGDVIINTTSVTAYRGSKQLIMLLQKEPQWL